MYLYRWNIEKVEDYPEVNGLQQVVGVVGWELEVRDTSDHSVHYIRTETKLATPSSEGFVDYLELSNEYLSELKGSSEKSVIVSL